MKQTVSPPEPTLSSVRNRLTTPDRIDEVRATFTQGLSRLCLSLAVGHFLCLVPLYLIFGERLAGQSLAALSLSGAGLLLIAFLGRYERIRGVLSYFCLGLLFIQSAYYLSLQTTLLHPITMLFPLLCALAPPITGRGGGYRLAALSALLFAGLHFARAGGNQGLGSLALCLMGLVFSAYFSETLWDGMLRREAMLKAALAALERKTEEMEGWIQRLGHASELISAGQLSTSLPTPPPSQVFEELTRHMTTLQARVNQHFTDLFLRDRLNSLGVLASGVAHELNTPLTTLNFVLQSAPEISETTRQQLLTEVDRMSKIARALLSFARPGTEESVDLEELVLRTEPLFKRVPCGHAPIRFEVQRPAERLVIHAVASEVQQVLLNLFQNSVDALEGRADPRIGIRLTGGKERTAELEFSDNGCGIDTRSLSRILDPFFTTKPPGKGTGLGLFITHQIVQRHGARIEVQSQRDRGTTVRLIFPRVTADDFSKEAA